MSISTFVRCPACFVRSWEDYRERCATGLVFSVGNTLKAKLEGLGTCVV